ncbi:sigma-54-dependent Fis family transcriptional regulator [Inquilinus sp. CA228]|uniref:sigma-54-dependent Fis family transcriptional regulator n=1 Tax=Inquilinus sp. CA228 TaxID=3455609 RepID=UPI003F8D76C3
MGKNAPSDDWMASATPAPERGLSCDAVEEVLQLGTLLATERDPDRLLDLILEAACRLTRSGCARIYVLDATKTFLVLRACHPEPVQTRGPGPSIPLYAGRTQNLAEPRAHAALTGRTVRLADIREPTGYDCSLMLADQREGPAFTALLVVPLSDPGRLTLGVLELGDPCLAAVGDVSWSSDAVERVTRAFASLASAALTNAALLVGNGARIEVLDREKTTLRRDNIRLRYQLGAAPDARFETIIGKSLAMERVFVLVDRIIDTHVPVLITGETGTGKELIAQAIHRNSPRRDKAFIAQNCAAMPAELLESEFFGYRRGAFTGAVQDKIGLFEKANGGTILLDEIGDMPLNLQAKILRVLQEGEIRPLGDTKSRTVDVRILAATHRDLRALIEAGQFREDLFYRLSVFPIRLPALRERPEDLPQLVDHFLRKFAALHQRPIAGLDKEVRTALDRYPFPGNVRELANIVERAVLLCPPNQSIIPQYLPSEVLDARHVEPRETSLPVVEDDQGLRGIMRRFEANVIESYLERHAWNQTRAADALDISRRSLISKMDLYGLRRTRRP